MKQRRGAKEEMNSAGNWGLGQRKSLSLSQPQFTHTNRFLKCQYPVIMNTTSTLIWKHVEFNDVKPPRLWNLQDINVLILFSSNERTCDLLKRLFDTTMQFWMIVTKKVLGLKKRKPMHVQWRSTVVLSFSNLLYELELLWSTVMYGHAFFALPAPLVINLPYKTKQI